VTVIVHLVNITRNLEFEAYSSNQMERGDPFINGLGMVFLATGLRRLA